jgi:hypothetical protein
MTPHVDLSKLIDPTSQPTLPMQLLRPPRQTIHTGSPQRRIGCVFSLWGELFGRRGGGLFLRGRVRRLARGTFGIPGTAVRWRDIAEFGELVHDVKLDGDRAKVAMSEQGRMRRSVWEPVTMTSDRERGKRTSSKSRRGFVAGRRKEEG